MNYPYKPLIVSIISIFIIMLLFILFHNTWSISLGCICYLLFLISIASYKLWKFVLNDF